MTIPWWWLACASASAQAPAEVARLEEELVKLAQRNTWAGVDRTYRRLLEHGVPLPPQDHYLAAQAALARGDTLLAWYRLRRGERADPGVDTIQRDAHEASAREAETIGTRYGLVSIYVGDGGVPALMRDAMPFAQQERDAIIAAQKTLLATRAFRGLLPVGSYGLDTVRFEVTAADDADMGSYQVVIVGDR